MNSHLLALTPPMGWNSWNTFGCNISEELIRESADALLETGLSKLGYRYVVIDDFWEADTRKNGQLTWDPHRFPSGIPHLANYIHQKGLLFGIYSCAGTHTCAGKPGSFGYEWADAHTFAEWGVDYLKYDFCFHPPEIDGKISYRKMGQALRSTGRPIVYSLCNWGLDNVQTWGRSVGGHLWRTTGDIVDQWHSIYDIGFRKQVDLWPYAGPGGWNDPDMLVVGMRGKGNAVGEGEKKGCTNDEYWTHFALWCMLAAPLMIGCDIRNMDSVTLQILSCKGLIEIDQDPLGVQARKLGVHRNVEIWSRPLVNGDIAVAFFNLGPSPNSKTPVAWESLGLPEKVPCKVKNVITEEELGVFTIFYNSGTIPSHGCEVVRISPFFR